MRWALALALAGGAAIGVACGDSFQTGSGGTGGSGNTTTTTTTTGASGGGGGGSTTTSSGGGADPACDKDQRCVPAVPEGWVGPLSIEASSNVDANAAPCGAAFDNWSTAYLGPLDSPPVTCHACGCGSPDMVECGPPEIELHAGPSCMDGATDYAGPAPGAEGTCTLIDPALSLSGIIVVPSEPITGQCAPSGGGIATAPDAQWSGRAAMCQVSALGAACGGGGVCSPKPHAPYGNVCVAQDGESAGCPTGFGNALVVYKNMVDERDCTPCGCGAPMGGTCSTLVTMYNASPCNAIDKTLGMGCVTASNAWNFLKWTANPTAQGICAVQQGMPQGKVVPDGPITVCCVDPIALP